VQAQTWGTSKSAITGSVLPALPNPVAGCVHWIVTLPELGGQLLDLGMPFFFVTIWACNLQRQGHPLLWFDETRSMGHGHLQGYGPHGRAMGGRKMHGSTLVLVPQPYGAGVQIEWLNCG